MYYIKDSPSNDDPKESLSREVFDPVQIVRNVEFSLGKENERYFAPGDTNV